MPQAIARTRRSGLTISLGEAASLFQLAASVFQRNPSFMLTAEAEEAYKLGEHSRCSSYNARLSGWEL